MLKAGARVGDYRVVRLLGEGGMASVYVATHSVLGTRHALKVLDAKLRTSPDARQRFLEEARIQATQLDHPNIVKVTNIVSTHAHAALVMELVDGTSLEDECTRLAGNPREIKRIMFAVLDAVGHAHDRGVVHRDLKPANILLGGPGRRPMVSDFGIAKVVTNEGQSLTRTGARMGTLSYMSPEQILHTKGVSAASDVFSLGVMLYELATGSLPFVGENDYTVMDAILKGRYVPAERNYPYLDPIIARVIRRALEHDPVKRFTSCREMSDALCAPAVSAPDIKSAPFNAPALPNRARPLQASAAIPLPSATVETRKPMVAIWPLAFFLLVAAVGAVALVVLVSSSSNGAAPSVAAAAAPRPSTPRCSMTALDCHLYSANGEAGAKLYTLITQARQAARFGEAICLSQDAIQDPDPWFAGAGYFESSIAWQDLGCHELAVSAVEQSLRVRPKARSGWKEACAWCVQIHASCSACSLGPRTSGTRTPSVGSVGRPARGTPSTSAGSSGGSGAGPGSGSNASSPATPGESPGCVAYATALSALASCPHLPPAMQSSMRLLFDQKSAQWANTTPDRWPGIEKTCQRAASETNQLARDCNAMQMGNPDLIDPRTFDPFELE